MRSVLLVGRSEAPDPSDLLPLLEALTAASLRVVLLATEDHRPLAASAGVRFRLLPSSPGPRTGRGRRRDRVRDLRAILRSVFVEPLLAQWSTVERVVQEERVDVVLADALCIAACMLAVRPREERPPVVLLGTIPPPHAHPGAAPYGLGLPPDPSALNRARNVVLHLVGRHLLLRPVLRDLRRAFRELSGLIMVGDSYAAAGLADVWAQCSPEAFEYPLEERRNIRFTGPLRPGQGVPPEWWDPADPRRVVMVRATAHVPLAALVVPTVEAFAGSDRHVVVTGTTAEAVSAALGGPLPPHVDVAEGSSAGLVVPGSAVLVANATFVHVQHALQQGVPVVATGTGAEEAETGARLEWHGCGVRLRADRPDAGQVREAVERVLADPSFRRAAARFGAQAAVMDAEPSVVRLVEELCGAQRETPTPRPASTR